MSEGRTSLDALRRDIDRIDDSIHDLLMDRARAVAKLRAAKRGGKAGSFLRPGREALILRRLAARHHGPFPAQALMRIWREIFAALTSLQGPFSVAVFFDERGPDYRSIAREHFGSITPITRLARSGQVVAAVSDGSASVGVVPMPMEQDDAPWWRHLLTDGKRRIRIVGRLPFVRDGVNRIDEEALVIGRMPFEETGDDRSYLVSQSQDHISRGRLAAALNEHGLRQLFYAPWRDEQHPVAWNHLVEIPGRFDGRSTTIRRLAKSFEPAIDKVYALGGYAVPLDLSVGEKPS